MAPKRSSSKTRNNSKKIDLELPETQGTVYDTEGHIIERRTERLKYQQPKEIVIQDKSTYVPKTGIARLRECWAIEVGTVLLPYKTKVTMNFIIFCMFCFTVYSTFRATVIFYDFARELI
jgi:hypothetical protein